MFHVPHSLSFRHYEPIFGPADAEEIYNCVGASKIDPISEHFNIQPATEDGQSAPIIF